MHNKPVTVSHSADTREQTYAVRSVAIQLQHLLADAARMGVVVTVELQPLEPLAMRNYRMVGDVRGAR